MTDIRMDDITRAESDPDRKVDLETVEDGVAKPDEMFIDEALAGTQLEHSLGTREAVKAYWKAIVLVALIELTIVMRGFDASVANSFFGLPAFQKRYGVPVEGHGYQVKATWQSALGISVTVGQVIGSIASTYPMEYFGRRQTLAVCLLITTALIPMEAFAPSIQVLVAGEYLAALVLGFYQVLIPTYSSELLPDVLRPYLAGYINTCYNIGGLIISGVTTSFATWESEWAYKIPFCLQWMWPAIVLPVLLIAPESPWWLVRKGKVEEARKALNRLGDRNHPKVDFDKTIAMMQKTALYENKVETGGSIWDCFRGGSRYRTEIVIMIGFAQGFASSPLSAAYFYEQLGFSTQKSFDLNMGGSAVSFTSSLLSTILLNRFGRRPVFTGGIALCSVLQLLVGFLQLPENYDSKPGYGYGQVVALFLVSVTYNLTIGPFLYTILSEVPSISLRSKTISVSIMFDALFGIVTNFITPYLVNPAYANAKGRVCFMYGGISVFSTIWCILRLPETKFRTVEELDFLFEHRVNARKFKGYVISAEDLRHNLDQDGGTAGQHLDSV